MAYNSAQKMTPIAQIADGMTNREFYELQNFRRNHRLVFMDQREWSYRRAPDLVAGVYVLLGSADRVLYIGESNNIAARVADHLRDKTFHSFAFIKSDERKKVEADLIRIFSPQLNGRNNLLAKRSDFDPKRPRGKVMKYKYLTLWEPKRPWVS